MTQTLSRSEIHALRREKRRLEQFFAAVVNEGGRKDKRNPDAIRLKIVSDKLAAQPHA